jgi:hypothetical protein
MNETGGEFATARDRHLFGPGPKRLLALDGGGVRGAVTVAFLERIETLLDARYGEKVRLADHVDLVGGTSTGAIIAGLVALGYRAEEIRDFYLKLAPFAFKRQWYIPILQAKFDVHGLRSRIAEVIGDRRLSSEDLITGLGIVTKRVDTGSSWIVSNNPRAPYWEPGAGYIGNKDYSLANLVRASTAAPHYFEPELLPILPGGELQGALLRHLNRSWLPLGLRRLLARIGLQSGKNIDPNAYGLFVDGGLTPHNNPSLALLQLATLSPFGIQWRTGVDHLTVVSVGTGSFRLRLPLTSLGYGRFAKVAYHALLSMIADSQMMVLALMQWLGECPAPWEINSEIKTLAHEQPIGGKMFRFLRYDVRLEKDWLARELGYQTSDADIKRLRSMDNPGNVPELYKLGCIAAAMQVKPEHWGV